VIDTSVAGSTVACPRCGWVHSVPKVSAGVSEPAGEAVPSGARRRVWLSPLVASALSCVAVLCVLVWALLAETGHGAGGEGTGTGLAAGDGSGTDKFGTGTDSSTTGKGPSTPTPATTTSPQTRPQQPSTAPVEIATIGIITPVEPVEPPAAPNSAQSGDGGREGGGGFGNAKPGPSLGAKGDVSFTLVWTYDIDRQGAKNTGGPDVDIWVEDPRGNVINTSEQGSTKKGPTREGGRADYDDRGAYGTDALSDGGGPERVFWPTGKAPEGTYRYGVRWYQGRGRASYALQVYRGATLTETKRGLLTDNDKGRQIEVGSLVFRRSP